MDPIPDGRASDNESGDSFYSFNSSGNDLDYDCGNPIWEDPPPILSNSESESEHETSGPLEVQESSNPLPLPEVCLPLPECSTDSAACNGVSTSKGAQQQNKVEDSPPNRTEEPLPMSSSQVPKLDPKQMPSLEHLNLDSPQPRVKDYLAPDPKKEAMQKIAFTEIWVNWQKKSTEPNHSPPEFSAALDAYFEPSANKKGNPIVQPIVEPAKTIVKD